MNIKNLINIRKILLISSIPYITGSLKMKVSNSRLVQVIQNEFKFQTGFQITEKGTVFCFLSQTPIEHNTKLTQTHSPTPIDFLDYLFDYDFLENTPIINESPIDFEAESKVLSKNKLSGLYFKDKLCHFQYQGKIYILKKTNFLLFLLRKVPFIFTHFYEGRIVTHQDMIIVSENDFDNIKKIISCLLEQVMVLPENRKEVFELIKQIPLNHPIWEDPSGNMLSFVRYIDTAKIPNVFCFRSCILYFDILLDCFKLYHCEIRDLSNIFTIIMDILSTIHKDQSKINFFISKLTSFFQENPILIKDKKQFYKKLNDLWEFIFWKHLKTEGRAIIISFYINILDNDITNEERCCFLISFYQIYKQAMLEGNDTFCKFLSKKQKAIQKKYKKFVFDEVEVTDDQLKNPLFMNVFQEYIKELVSCYQEESSITSNNVKFLAKLIKKHDYIIPLKSKLDSIPGTFETYNQITDILEQLNTLTEYLHNMIYQCCFRCCPNSFSCILEQLIHFNCNKNRVCEIFKDFCNMYKQEVETQTQKVILEHFNTLQTIENFSKQCAQHCLTTQQLDNINLCITMPNKEKAEEATEEEPQMKRLKIENINV